MKYRRLDINGDMTAGLGNQDFLYSAEAVGQAVKTRLLLLYSEWWENTEDGLPLFEKILGVFGKQKIKAAELIIKKRIRTTLNVISVKNLETTLNNREFSVVCDIDTVFGMTKVEVSI